jgi:membrane protein required for colicin V production
MFDLIAMAVIAISALMGFQRGAVRELVGLFAFGVSAVACLALLPITSKLAAPIFHPHLFALVAAVITGFAVVYLGLKFIGHWIATQLHQQAILGGADRALGLGIGAVRALILLGLFALVFDRATPEGMKPPWITSAFLYPLASASGRALGAFAPTGLRLLGHPTGLLNGGETPDTDQINETGAAPVRPPAPPPTAHPAPRKGKGYDQRSRDQLDKLVERTR